MLCVYVILMHLIACHTAARVFCFFFLLAASPAWRVYIKISYACPFVLENFWNIKKWCNEWGHRFVSVPFPYIIEAHSVMHTEPPARRELRPMTLLAALRSNGKYDEPHTATHTHTHWHSVTRFTCIKIYLHFIYCDIIEGITIRKKSVCILLCVLHIVYMKWCEYW